jgi:hypothetical protein
MNDALDSMIERTGDMEMLPQLESAHTGDISFRIFRPGLLIREESFSLGSWRFHHGWPSRELLEQPSQLGATRALGAAGAERGDERFTKSTNGCPKHIDMFGKEV